MQKRPRDGGGVWFPHEPPQGRGRVGASSGGSSGRRARPPSAPGSARASGRRRGRGTRGAERPESDSPPARQGPSGRRGGAATGRGVRLRRGGRAPSGRRGGAASGRGAGDVMGYPFPATTSTSSGSAGESSRGSIFFPCAGLNKTQSILPVRRRETQTPPSTSQSRGLTGRSCEVPGDSLWRTTSPRVMERS